MKISFIVPVYRVEKYIVSCLRSIQQQTLHDFECLVIDDGSPDRSCALAQEHFAEDARFRFFHKTNGGLSDARNYGMKQACGEYLCFVDSDDTIAPSLAEECVEYGEKNNCDIVCFDMLYVYEQTKRQEISRGGVQPLSSFLENPEILLWNNSANNKIYRRRFLANKEFMKDLWYEDLAMIPWWMSQAKKIGYIDKPFYHYLQRTGSISHSADPRVFDVYTALHHVREKTQAPDDIFAKLVLENGLVMTTLRIKEMDDRKQRLAFYERNLAQLQELLPHWYRYALQADYTWKQKVAFTLLKGKQFSLLDRMYQR